MKTLMMKVLGQAERRKKQAGFSLIEMIVSLAIVSLVSAALFQSMSTWIELSSRASTAADQSVANIASQKMFDRAIGGFVFAWPDEENSKFSGSPTAFSGLSQTTLESVAPQLAAIQLSIDNTTTPQRLTYKTDEVEWVLASFNDDNAAFSYLGADGVWYPFWPPATNPEPSQFDDAAYFETPQFPLAVKLTFNNTTGANVWIADISSNPQIPIRTQDLSQ